MNVDTASYEDMTLVYSFFDFIDKWVVSAKWPNIGIVSLMSKKRRFEEIYCRSALLSHCQLPLDIAKFDNNV